ncbi:ArgE/DapE family deacylase [Salinicoccus bachuensis]|uniref:ArgE/DapE family deacylase n=1 Tax=Salinicoccus bachuensis TaxID=3136731 RepID=A0ABZ3CLV8_9STAP
MNESVEKAIDSLWNEELLFLKTVASYDSTLGNEREVQLFIEEYLKDMGLQTDSFDVDTDKVSKYRNYGQPEWGYKDRPVVVGTRKSEGDGKSLILQAHIDVVDAGPESHWEGHAYTPRIKDGRMYGRGVLDMKGGLAANIFALKALEAAGVSLGGDVQIQTVIEEEVTGNGALALLEAGYTADGALIPEPTQHRILTSQVGVIYLRVTVKGAGAHVERAEQAQNAVMKAYKVIEALEGYREHINGQEKHPAFKSHPHPLNVNVGKMKGGDWTSSVPVECVFEARVGCYPGTDPKDIQKEVKSWLLKASEEDEWLRENPPEIEFFGFNAHGFEMDTGSELYETMAASHRRVKGSDVENLSFTATTDVRAFDEFGIPVTCYGPTGGDMHAPNEYMDLESLKDTTKAIAYFMMDWCNSRKD